MDIYTITTLYIDKKIDKSQLSNDRSMKALTLQLDILKRSRTVGFFEKLKDAIETVLGNYGDIYENGHYNYCVIEKLSSGLYSHTSEHYWFYWTGSIETGSYKEIPNPPFAEHISNFAIG